MLHTNQHTRQSSRPYTHQLWFAVLVGIGENVIMAVVNQMYHQALQCRFIFKGHNWRGV